MDSFDIKILELVQRNNRLTAEQIAEEVSLSPSACQRRLKLLRDNGTIVADISVISPAAIGRRMTMVVKVTLEREQPDKLEAFQRSMLATPEVMQCYYVTGEEDFILILTARDMEDYVAFTKRFFFENPNVRHFQTSVVMSSVKVGLALPLGEPDKDIAVAEK